jgi:hypothetical protein
MFTGTFDLRPMFLVSNLLIPVGFDSGLCIFAARCVGFVLVLSCVFALDNLLDSTFEKRRR